MTKRFILLFAIVTAGCAQDLTAPLSSVPITSMADYFWAAGSSEVFDSDHIAAYDSLGALMVNDSTPNGTLRSRIVCHVSPDSVTAEHFESGSIFDLDKGSMFVAEEDTTLTGSRHPGSVLLLKSNPLVDSAWRMGTLMDQNYKSHAIEARFLTRLDTLTVAGVTYPDILVIRYALDNHPRFTADSTTVPYWVIYYARGRGPIEFDKEGGGKFERRAILP